MFLGAVVPIVGALLTGGAAVLIALVANGPGTALIVLGIIILIMQLEGHVHTSSPEETGPDEPGLDRRPDLGDGLPIGR